MGAIVAAVSAIAPIVSAVSPILGMMNQQQPDTSGQEAALREQAAATRKATELQNRQAEIQARQQRIRSVRDARVARANVVSAGAAAGVPDSSSVFGGAGSIQSQLASNLGVSNTLQGLENQRADALTQANTAGNIAQSEYIQNQAAMQSPNIFNTAGDVFSKFSNALNKK